MKITGTSTVIQRVIDDEVFCLGEYRPPGRYRYRDRFSRRILELKHGSPIAIQYFLQQLVPLATEASVIVVVPGHRAYCRRYGIYLLAASWASEVNLIDATDCLVRIREIQKLSYGGSRNLKQHIDTIEVEHGAKIIGRSVILLDDVIATGNSMQACRQILIAAGARKLSQISLGCVL